MEKVRLWCCQPSDRGRLKKRTEQNSAFQKLFVYQEFCDNESGTLRLGLAAYDERISKQELETSIY